LTHTVYTDACSLVPCLGLFPIVAQIIGYGCSPSDILFGYQYITRFPMKLFRSSTTEVIAECPRYFGFSLPSELIEKKQK